jgi:hypothetical protein
MSDDVWTAGDTGGDGPRGLPVNKAFSVDVVFRSWLALVQERPGLLAAIGGLYIAMQVVLTVISLPIALSSAAIQASVDNEVLKQVLPTLLGQSLNLVAIPVQCWLMGGFMTAIADSLRSDEVRYEALFTSFGPGLRLLGYTVVGTLLGLPLAAACFGPGAALGAVAHFVLDLDPWVAIASGSAVGLLGLFPFVYVSLGLTLGAQAAVLEGMGPFEAIVASWRAARGARVTLLVLQFALVILPMFFIVAGLCCCYLPGFVAQGVWIGLYMTAMTTGWSLYYRPADETAKWSFFQRHPYG